MPVLPVHHLNELLKSAAKTAANVRQLAAAEETLKAAQLAQPSQMSTAVPAPKVSPDPLRSSGSKS